MPKKSKLYLFVGYPGAGKTTIAKLIHEVTGATHIWADQERQAMFDSVNHTKEESDALYAHLNERTEKLLAAGKSVIFDTNFNYLKDRQYMCVIASRNNAEVLIVWMKTPLAVARKRALHEHHRDRNGYDHVMKPEDFDRLTDHLEPPEVNENFIIIDGSDIDIAAVKRQFEG